MDWKKAWHLDDSYRQSISMVFKKNDLLYKAIGRSQYLTWWWLADGWLTYQKLCEIMARLVCHASRLKSDDLRYKGAIASVLACRHCDLIIVESVVHLVMQCPTFESRRKDMLEVIYTIL